MTGETTFIADRIGLRAIYLAPLGRHTRYMLAGYLRNVLMVTAVLLAVALTIDLWPQVDMISNGAGGVRGMLWHILRFAALRTPGLVAPLLPFATFLGVVATEVAHTRTGERMLVWNSGRSPLKCLTPALLLGVMLGATEFILDAYLGPAAMKVQMHERLGRDGQRLDRTRTDESHWIASSSGLLSAGIEYGPPPVLHNLTFYKLDAHGQLAEIDKAAVAHQLPGSDQWLMSDGRFWVSQGAPADAGAADSAPALGDPADQTLVPFAERTVSLALDPLWLSVYGMETQYLPMKVVRRLARFDRGPMAKGLYRTRLQVLYGETLLPGAMALLAASLSVLLLAYRTPARAVVGILFAGYLAHATTKACLLIGQNGYMPPIVAGWFVPVTLLAATFAAFRIIEPHRGRIARREAPLAADVPSLVSAE